VKQAAILKLLTSDTCMLNKGKIITWAMRLTPIPTVIFVTLSKKL